MAMRSSDREEKGRINVLNKNYCNAEQFKCFLNRFQV